MKRPIVIILLVLAIDQFVKIYIKSHFVIGEEYKVASWFIIHFTENNGMAYGMQLSGQYGKILLSVFRIAAVVVIGWYLWDLVKKKAHPGLITSIALIFAGALGNILDSAFYGLIFSSSDYEVAKLFPQGGGYASFLHGKVVDMLYFPIMNGHFPSWFPFWGGEEYIFFRPVFNCSDSAITIGVLLILLFQRRFYPRKAEEKNVTDVSNSNGGGETPQNI
ncbi:MAG TPA: lipoprotein signal peptidase [Bacteroidia bacterium]|nr:lipoprotein signal peptidase [Bacteroidia bacterium]